MKQLWNLGRVKQIIEEALNLEITHVYEDMVFIEHSALMIVFDHEDTGKFNCYFNTECPIPERDMIFAQVNHASPRNKMIAVNKGTFILEQLEGEEIRVVLKDG
jgi:hypothetical protein